MSRFATILVIAASGILHPRVAGAASGATILVWSDLHGRIPPGLKTIVDSLRDAGAKEGRAVVALDAGDALLGSRLSQLTRGVSQTAELNFLKPDAMTLGMGDFAWNRERLDSLLRTLEVPVVTTNLRRNVDDQPLGGRKSLVVERAGVKVGVIGIADPELDYPERQDKNGDMRVDPEDAAASWESAALRQAGASLVVALVHANVSVAQKIARVEGVDLVLAAHDAKEASLARSGTSWIAHVVPGAGTLLRIDLEPSDTGWSARSSSLPIPASTPLNAAWKAMVAAHDSLLTQTLAREVGTLKTPWPATRREAPLGDWLADALRGGTGADLALVPASWIQTGLPKGRVRVGDVWNTVPAGLNMVSVFTLPGSDVMKFLERQMRRSKEFLFVSGLVCTPDSSMFGGSPVTARIGGKLLDKGAYYKIAIPNQLRADIDELTGISESSAAPEWTGLWESDVVVKWAVEHGLSVEGGRVPAMYGGTAPK